MDGKEITMELNRNALRFCMQFLPNGRRVGNYWATSDILDSKRGGKSFVVYLKDKIGYWVENGEPSVAIGKNGGKSGFLLDIIIAQRGLSYSGAINFAKDWLGIVDKFEPRYVRKKPIDQNPDFISTRHLNPIEEGSRAYDYLCKERGLSIDVIRKYRVQSCRRWFKEFGHEVDAVAFPIYSGKGDDATLLNIKYLALERVNGKKLCSQESGGSNHLFGWQSIDGDFKEIVICEGEIDAMTVSMCGFAALSVPEGAHSDGEDGKENKANAWINNDWDKLEKYELIRVCMDSDSVGKAAAATLFQRLGVHRTEVVQIPSPWKDPNEMFVDGEAEALKAAILSSSGIDPKELAHVKEFAYKLKERLDGKAGVIGRSLPWSLGDIFRIRNYEVTVVSGYSGHGKTSWLDDLLVNLCANGESCCIASLEIPIANTLETLFRQCTGRRNYFEKSGYIIPNLFENAMLWLNERFFFYNHVGRVNIDNILNTFKYCYRRYGTCLFVIDSLMCCDVDEDDRDGQKIIMQKLCDFVMECGVHLFLVAHSKKPSEKRREDKDPPGKHDVNGSVHITNLPHNVIVIYRCIAKEEALAKARFLGNKDDEENITKQYDAVMYLRKQREGSGALAAKHLWFDAASRQFRDGYTRPIRHFVEGDTNLLTM